MILQRILATKAEEVAAARTARPLAVVKAAAEAASAPGGPVATGSSLAPRNPLAPRGFFRALRDCPGLGVIAEVKKASPSKGVIRPDFDPVAIARAYESAGAACLSVLTDEQYFQGSLAYLEAIRAAVALPLLRKDFIVDAYQIYEARAAGADAILLIVAAFSGDAADGRTPDDMARLAGIAAQLGMDVLTEVHTAAELDVALASGAGLVGINNRDLKSFYTSLEVTEALAPAVPDDRLLVSESGIGTPADMARVARAGAKAVLVGESLMRQPDVAQALRDLMAGPAPGGGADVG